jgi:TatD DNase family protein
MLTDTHAHLDFPELQADFPGVLARAAEAGIHRIISIGTTVESSTRALGFASEHPQIHCAVGIHPNNAHEVQPDYLDQLRRLAGSPRVAAIGEIGLDWYWLPSAAAARGQTMDDPGISEEEMKRRQEEVFRAQLDLSIELGLNVVIHQRSSWDDTLRVLREYRGRVRTVFHCFGEHWERAQELFDLGHIVSFTGIVTFKNGAQIQDVARRIPSDLFMVETDAPFLAPTPLRGKRCEPAYTRLTAEFIAKLRGELIEGLAENTERTAERFFRLHA